MTDCSWEMKLTKFDPKITKPSHEWRSSSAHLNNSSWSLNVNRVQDGKYRLPAFQQEDVVWSKIESMRKKRWSLSCTRTSLVKRTCGKGVPWKRNVDALKTSVSILYLTSGVRLIFGKSRGPVRTEIHLSYVSWISRADVILAVVIAPRHDRRTTYGYSFPPGLSRATRVPLRSII